MWKLFCEFLDWAFKWNWKRGSSFISNTYVKHRDGFIYREYDVWINTKTGKKVIVYK